MGYGSNKKVWKFLINSPEDREVYTESQTTAHRPTLPQPQSWWRMWHSWLVRLAGSGPLLHLQIVWKWSCFSVGESNKLLNDTYLYMSTCNTNQIGNFQYTFTGIYYNWMHKSLYEQCIPYLFTLFCCNCLSRRSLFGTMNTMDWHLHPLSGDLSQIWVLSKFSRIDWGYNRI